MACTRPIRGRRDADGKVRLLKGVPDARLFGTGDKPELELPCGRCMDCKIRRTQDWVTRATHEASLHQDNSFITLTFSDEGLALRELQRGTHPYDLDIKDWQLFAKRLRKAAGPFRFFQVGEYGDENLRPHYHALIFGRAYREGAEEWIDAKGHRTWTSPIVEKCWQYGFHEIKEATPESIAYVCKYVQKKLYGQALKALTERVDSETGESITVRPELASMSRGRKKGEGIGGKWYQKYKSDVFPDDHVILGGIEKPVPKYYTSLLKQQNEKEYEQLQAERIKSAASRVKDNTPERRLVREKVTKGKLAIRRKREL